jgi:DNA-binding NarL/FixJ family response regulator
MFVLNQVGKVLFTSPSGETLLKHNSTNLQHSLAAMVRSGSPDSPWIMMRLQARDRSRVFLLIQETPLASPKVDPVSVASSSWHLTQRQHQVLDLVARGLTNVDAAKVLEVTESTVEYHLSKIFDKAGVDNRATLIIRMRDLSSKPEPVAISVVRRLSA